MVILYEDIFGSQPLTAAIEDMPTLPKAHLDAIEDATAWCAGCRAH